MPKPAAEDYHPGELEEALSHHGLRHLRVRRRGDTLTIESGSAGRGAFPHARMRRETVHLWRLELPTSTGRWETTPLRDVIDHLVALLISDLSWTLAEPPSLPSRPRRTR